MNLDPEKVLFRIDHDGVVFLCVSPLYIRVCDSAKDFSKFHKSLLKELGKIAKEIQEYNT